MDENDRDDLFSGDDEEFGGFDANFGSGETDALPDSNAGSTENNAGVTDTVTPETNQGDTSSSDDFGEFDIGNTSEPEKTQEKEPEKSVTEKAEPEKSEDESGTSEAPKRGRQPRALKKRARKPLTKRQKVLRVILRRAGLEKLPDLATLMRDKSGVSHRIGDIALFIGEPKDEILAELSENFSNKNIVNLSAEVEKNRVISVGADVLRAGRMFQPIQVADILEKGESVDNLQCTSGRHRLAFLALAYGPNAEIPVYVENMTLNEARDAVVVANQSRPTRALERAEHAVLGSTGGVAHAQQKAIYEATATTKVRARKYCVYSVFEKGYPLKLKFSVSPSPSRKNGELTTVSNVENFWSSSLRWEKGMPCKDFDDALKASIVFLNGLVTAMQKEEAFDPVHHLASMTLSAVGKWYRAYKDVVGTEPDTEAVAKIIVGMGEIGRQKSETTYQALTEAMRS